MSSNDHFCFTSVFFAEVRMNVTHINMIIKISTKVSGKLYFGEKLSADFDTEAVTIFRGPSCANGNSHLK